MSTSVFLENVLRRINDGGVPPDTSVSHFPHNSTVHLIFPEVGANARQIIEILKVLEILTFLRGISPYGVMDRDALNDLTDFLKEAPSATRYGRSLLPSDSIGYADGIRASIFEVWMLKRLNNFPIYPLQDIRKGSYEFIFQTVNLAAIFGLQDYATLKDLIQWVTGAISTVVNRKDFSFQEPLRSGKEAAIRLTPRMVTALSQFRKVEFTDEIKFGGDRKISIRLER